MYELTEDEKRRIEEALDKYKEANPNHTILFATVSGSHLYGTNTSDADIDLRGCYSVPAENFFGIKRVKETTEFKHLDVEFQFHEVGKFLGLLIGSNMNFVEALKSHLRVVWTKEADELLKIADQTISKEMFAHIQGMSIHTWKHAGKEHFQIPKRDLYLYREILRGLVLFKDGEFKSNVLDLANQYGDQETIEWVRYLLIRKHAGEKAEPIYVKKIKDNITRLQSEMLTQKEFSSLAHEKQLDNRKINKWLVDLRLEGLR